MGLPRCKNCEHQPPMTSLSAKVSIGVINGKKKYVSKPVGAVCFECMYAEIINPYTAQVANIREATPFDKAWAILKRGGLE